MARSDLLLKLVKAGAQGDQLLFRKTVEALIAEERAKQHHILADRLAEQMRNNGVRTSRVPPLVDDRIGNLIHEVVPQRRLQDLVLPDNVERVCNELIEEHHRADLLRSYNLEPRHSILLQGPPGNGKTSLAEALAEGLMVPMIVIRYEGVIGAYLGETAVRLRQVFDYARARHCVLFFDEFDTLGKERGDVHDAGEIKRVVSSLLLQVDALPSHVVVITATNHPELLDRAVWRRFQVRLLLPKPGRREREQWFVRFQTQIGRSLGHPPRLIAERLEGLSYSEVEDFCADVLRRFVLSLPEGSLESIVAECLLQWEDQTRLSTTKE